VCNDKCSLHSICAAMTSVQCAILAVILHVSLIEIISGAEINPIEVVCATHLAFFSIIFFLYCDFY